MMVSALLRLREPEMEELMRRVAAKDARALKAVYEQCSSRVMAVAVRILGSPDEAREVVQDVFLDVWRRADAFDGSRGKASSWIMAMARNRSIDRLRARGAAFKAVRKAKAEAHAVVKRGPSPLEDVEVREARARINAALDALPPEQREAVELAYFRGLSHTEIADQTGEPLGTVKGRIRAAMAKLGSLLSVPRGKGEC